MDKRGLDSSYRPSIEEPVELGHWLEEDTAPRVPPVQAPTPKETPAGSPAPEQTYVRKVNLTFKPETLRRFADILDHLDQFGVEEHPSKADTIDALISALHEALPVLDLSSVGTRGRYGSKKAEAYRVALRAAFTQAIGRRQADQAA